MRKSNFILYIFFLPFFINACTEDPSSPNSDNMGFDSEPVWSPDGRYIAYVGGDTASGFGIYTIEINGTNKRKFTIDFCTTPDWSPDGLWIAYVNGGNIFKKGFGNDTSTIQLTTDDNSNFTSWSPDGQYIAFDSDTDSPNGMHFIWKIRADGTDKKRIFYSPTIGEVREPDWFPDGIRLCVTRYVGHGAPEIAIIDTSGNAISLLTNDTEFERSPKVSNDGVYITFNRDQSSGRIFTVRSDGTAMTQITSNNSITPNWSPDGTKITYTNISGNNGRVWVMNSDGSNRQKLSY